MSDKFTLPNSDPAKPTGRTAADFARESATGIQAPAEPTNPAAAPQGGERATDG